MPLKAQPPGTESGRSIPSGRGFPRLLSWAGWARDWGWESRQREAGELLANTQSELDGVSSRTEKVFLSVGGRLMDLQVQAREIAEQTASAAALMANDSGALALLDEVLVAASGSGQHHDLTPHIREIQTDAKSIHQAIQAITPVVRTFDVLGMMTRIESAHFENAGTTFVGLAEAVAALSRQIREETGRTADSATILLATTTRAAGQMQEVARRLEENLGPLTRQASAEILKIREHRGQVSQAIQLLGARFEEVSRAIGEVVAGLQAHDIVRQQIEHVLEALRHPEVSGRTLPETARLQSAQLDNSRATFETSVNQIRQALADIERNIAEMAQESARVLGLSGGSDAAFLSSIASDLEGILTILESNRVSDRRLAEAAASVEQRVAEISETIAGVHRVGIEMQRIALNATIQAAQLGPEGGALEVVARAVQELARETESASDMLEGRLRATTDAARALGNATGSGGGSDERIAQLRRSVEDFGTIQDQARGDHARIVALTAGLTEQVRETIETFGTQHECLGVLAGTAEILRGLSTARPATGADGAGQTASKHAMPSRYTMQSERTVHESLYEARPDNVGCPEPGGQEDNVEYF